MKWLAGLLLGLSLSSPVIAAIAVTVLCDNGYPPYSYEENGEAKGLYLDILKAAFAMMPDYQVSIRPTPWRRGLYKLEKGQAFALFPPYYRPQERPYMDYSSPILEERLVVFVRAEVARTRRLTDFPADYAGLRVSLNGGFSSIRSHLYQEMLNKGLLQESRAKDNHTNLMKLYYGHSDVYINDRLSVLWELNNLQNSGELPAGEGSFLVEGPTLSTEHGYLGVTNQKPDDFSYKADFLRQFNAALKVLEQSGVIRKIVDRYLIEVIH